MTSNEIKSTCTLYILIDLDIYPVLYSARFCINKRPSHICVFPLVWIPNISSTPQNNHQPISIDVITEFRPLLTVSGF